MKRKKKADEVPSADREIAILIAETGASYATVRRWWRGEPVSAVVAYALRAAAKERRIRRRVAA